MKDSRHSDIHALPRGFAVFLAEMNCYAFACGGSFVAIARRKLP